MPSKPAQGGSSGTWGTQLNEFLDVALEADGDIKYAALGTGTATGSKFLRDDRTWALPPTAGAADEMFHNVKDSGAVGDNVADDTVAIQAALDLGATSGRPVYVPNGLYRITDTLTIAKERVIQGQSKHGARLYWPNDLGSGEFALKCTTNNDTAKIGLYDISIEGNPAGGALGVSPNDMKGIWAGSWWNLDRVRVRYFWAGIQLEGNHAAFRDVDVDGCYHNLYYGASSYGDGDHYFERCNIQGGRFSGIAVALGNSVQTDTFVRCHFGNAPYCFYREAGTPTRPFMLNSIFIGCNWEGVGNAYIWGSNTTDQCDQNQFSNNAFTWEASADYTLSGIPRTSAIKAGTFDQNIFWSAPGDYGGCTVAMIEAESLERNQFLNAKAAIDAVVGSSVPYLKANAGSGNGPFNYYDTGSSQGRFMELASGSVAIKQLLKLVDYRKVALSTAPTTDIPAGTAVQTTSTVGMLIPVAQRGTSTAIASGTVTEGTLVKPGATDGTVSDATGFADGPIIGVRVNPGSPATSGDVTIWLTPMVGS